MTAAKFEEWWIEKLLPNIPPSTLTVMDNAPYHSRRKEEYSVQSWGLDAKTVPYHEKCLKTEVWSIVK